MGNNNNSTGLETFTIKDDNENALIVTGQCSLLYSINSTNDFKSVTLLGASKNGIGFYYSYISLKKGDVLYLKRNTIDFFGYVIVY